MKQVSASEFEARCLELVDEAAAGEEIVIVKDGRPVARVIAVEPGGVEPLDVEWLTEP